MTYCLSPSSCHSFYQNISFKVTEPLFISSLLSTVFRPQRFLRVSTEMSPVSGLPPSVDGPPSHEVRRYGPLRTSVPGPSSPGSTVVTRDSSTLTTLFPLGVGRTGYLEFTPVSQS